MSSDKKLGFDVLVGQAIQEVYSWLSGDHSWGFTTDLGTCYELYISDDGPTNDSNAYLESIEGLTQIMGSKILSVDEESDSYGATIVLQTASNHCTITINHEHNGYYGFSYELVPIRQ